MERIDGRFVDAAIRKGYVTFAKVRECLDSVRNGGALVREMLVGLGWITQEQHDEVMKEVLETPPARNGVLFDDELCDELIRRGLVGAEGLYDAIRLADKYRTRDRQLKSLDEILIEMGFITAPQIESVRGRDSAEPIVLSEPTHLKLGEFAVRKGYITEKQLNECLALQEEERAKGEGRKLGEILLAKGYVDARRLQEILTRPPAEAKPLTIPGYELVAKIGQGAMGEIHKAKQLSVDRTVAVKIFPLRFARNAKHLESMVGEARLLAKLDHPNIVKVIDAGRTQDRYYYVMEYVDGTTVQKMLDWQKRVPERECLKIGMNIGLALAHAAEHKLVHRDIKPGNIMITKDGTVKLFDLGIAKILTGDDKREDFAVGTPYYMSPEACLRQSVDIRSDIYSLGATLYHCATGAPPFKGPTAESTAAMHLQREPVPPHELNPELSAEFSGAIMKMMKKDPAERQQSGAELARVLDDIMKNQLETSLGTKVKTTRRRIPAAGTQTPVFKTRVSWAAVAAAALITLLVCAGITTYLLHRVGALEIPFLK
jgi:tRNA A-37 threonylcarbamoyl transferase component Bud32